MQVNRNRAKRPLVILAVVLSAIGLSVLGTGTARASTPPPVQICNSSQTLCLNRQGGGTAGGTHVIQWGLGDPNNDFNFVGLGTWCKGGHVEIYAGGGCPFAIGSGLNSYYDGALIVEELNNTSNLCVANGYSYNGYERAQLQSCGSNGYVWIIGNCNEINTCQVAGPVISLFWTNQTYQHKTTKCESFDNTGAGNPIIMNDDCGAEGLRVFTVVY